MNLIKGVELTNLIKSAIENHEGKYVSYIKMDTIDANDLDSDSLVKSEIEFIYGISTEKMNFTYCLSETEVKGTVYNINKTYMMTGKQLNYLISKNNNGKALNFYAVLPNAADALGTGNYSMEIVATCTEDKLVYSQQDYLADDWKDLNRMVEELFRGWESLNDKSRVDIMRKCIDESYIYNRL